MLRREGRFEALDALIYAYKPEPREVDIGASAIVLDSSAFLRLGQYPDVIDYFASRHAGPLILPGQAVQEFWNNNLNVADSIATGINKKFDDLRKETQKVDDTFQDYSDKFVGLLDEFRTTFGYAYDGNTVRRTMSLFEVLKDRAIHTFVRRDKFSDFSAHRKRTKTPPGFKDDLDGDFFVWLDALDGLLLARAKGVPYSCTVIVSNDRKPDWSREGVAHPLLTAEMAALIQVPLEIWDVPKLVQKVAAASE